MSTRPTIIEGKLVADTKEFTPEMQKAREEARKLAKESEAAQNKLATQATKTGNAISGATSAVEAFASGGTRSVTGLTKSLAGVAGLLGPTGAIVGGTAVAGLALLEMVLRPRRELERLGAELDETLRKLRSAGDSRGLIGLASRITTGDRDLRLGDVGLGDLDPESRLGKSVLQALQGDGVPARLREVREEAARLREELEKVATAERKAGEGIATAAVDRAIRSSGLRDRIKLLDEEAAVLGRVQQAATDAAIQGTRIATREQQLAADVGKARDAFAARNKETREGAKASDQLATALEALESRLEAVAVKGDGPASLSLQLEALFKKVEKGGASAQQLARFRAEIDRLVAESSQQELSKLGQQLEDLVAQSTITATDDLALAAKRMAESYEEYARVAEAADTDEGRKLAAGWRAQAESAAAYNAQLIAVTRNLEEIAAKRQQASDLRGVGIGALGGADLGGISGLLLEGQQLEKIKQQLQDPTLDPRVRKQLEEERRKIEEKRFEAAKKTADLEAQAAQRVKENVAAASQWVDALTAAAAAVGGLNSALVRSLAGVSQILKGVEGISKAAKDAGGFAKLFSGGGGALAAASGVGAIVGGFAIIADSLDLFGTKSAERARQMQAAAIQWGRALEDFLITTQSSLEESLRQNLRRAQELVQQAAAATGLNADGFSFNSAADLREQIALLDQAASANRVVAARLKPFRDELIKLAETLEANEATLRTQNEARLLEATKDLEVRRLVTEGRTSEAEALRRQLGLQRELDAALTDTSAAGIAYAAALGEIIAAELAAAEAARERAQILSTLDDTLAINGLAGRDALDAIVEAIGRIAPELAGLADGFDLDTRAGLEGFRDRLRDYFNALSEDGIDDLEAPIVQLIKRILGGIEGALGALPEALDPIAAALEAFDVRAEVFGLTAAERLRGVLPLLAQQFEGIGSALEGIDLSSGDGLTTLRERLEGLVDAMTADGVIDEVEAPIIAAIRSILALITNTADEAAAAAAEAARIAEETRQATVAAARQSLRGQLELGDLSGQDAVAATVSTFAALAPALAGLLDVDLSTVDGLNQAKAILREVFAQIENGTISAEQLGALLGDELAAIILDLDGDFDTLIQGIGAVADAARRTAEELQDFAGEVGRDFLRATGDTLAADLAAIDDRIAKRLAKARALGASDETIAQLAAIGEAERNAAIQRAAEAAAREAERLAADLAREAEKAAAVSSNRVTVRSVQSISEVTGQVMSGYLRSISVDVRGIHDLLLRGGVTPTIRPPALPSAFAPIGSATTAAGTGVGNLAVGPISVTVSGAVAGSSPQTIGEDIGRSVLTTISSGLGRLAGLQDGSSRR